MLPMAARAQYFEVDGIVYKKTTDQTAMVVTKAALHNSNYSGVIVVPETVEHEGSVLTVTALGEEAFGYCTNITSITLPASIRSFGTYCFYNCNVTSLRMPDSLRSIGDHAFLYCDVDTICLPAHFESYGDCSFWARNLKHIAVEEGNPRYRSIGGWLYSKDSTTLYVVPDGVEGRIEVPSFVRSIARMGIGFDNQITHVTLNEGLTCISDFAFNCSTNIDSIVIPSTVVKMGFNPFSYCLGLNHISIAPGNTHYTMDGLMIYSAGYDTLFSCHKSDAQVSLHGNLRVLGGFECNEDVQNIEIPSSVTHITESCFSNCVFSSIVLPEHMHTIGVDAFSYNPNLSQVTMPQTLQVMGEGAFQNCPELTSIVIPDSLRIVPNEAFNSDLSLKNITWGNMVEEIGMAAFWSIAPTEVRVPATVKRVRDFAFADYLYKMKRIIFEGELDTIGSYVFMNARLNSIQFKQSMPPATDNEGPLEGIYRVNKIIIPCGALDNYLADSYWSQFADKYEEDCTAIESAQESEIEVYPNPATSHITIGHIDGVEQIEMVNTLGQKVLSQTAKGENMTVDVKHLGRGTYLLRLKTADGLETKKIVLR